MVERASRRGVAPLGARWRHLGAPNLLKYGEFQAAK